MSQVDSRASFLEQSITTERLGFFRDVCRLHWRWAEYAAGIQRPFRSDLPLNFHPAAIGASAGFTPSGAV